MWVEKLPNGHYRYAERYTDPLTGQSKRVSIVLEKNTKQAEKLAREILRTKMYTPPAPTLSFGDLCELYLADQKPILKPSTWLRNKYALNTLQTILGENTKPESMTAGWIRKRLLDTGKAPGTLNEHLKRLKTVLRWGYDNDCIPEVKCPANFKDVPRRSKIEDKFLEGEELTALLDSMTNDLWHDVTEFLSLSGMRFGETAALLRTDVDFTTRLISIDKTYDYQNDVVTSPKTYDSIRKIYMQTELLDLCKSIMYKSNVINIDNHFFPYNGRPISYYAYNKYLKDHSMKVLGRAITPHTLRHTHASLLMEQGVPIETISDRLGHADSKITKEIYLHITARLQEQRNEQIKDIKLIAK